jgi:hypothetical protein
VKLGRSSRKIIQISQKFSASYDLKELPNSSF